MFETKNGKSFPMLIHGLLRKNQKLNFEIISLKDRISNNPLSVQHLSKIMFHITNLLRECNGRNPNFLKSLSLDQIYVNKNIEDDVNTFIFEEDQEGDKKKQSLDVILFQLFHVLGFDIMQETFSKPNYFDLIINYLYDHIFEERQQDSQTKINEKHILERIFNVNIIKIMYDQPFSRVYLIETPYYINSQRNKIVVKWIKYISEYDMIQYLHREIRLLERVHDLENCTKLFCYTNVLPQQFIFMKYYDITLDDLNNEIGKNQVNVIDLIHLIKQMLLALKGLHDRQIIHRDLKPQNIMFEYLNDNHSIQNMRCVLIDLDRSDNNQIVKSVREFQSDYIGTPEYQPPEGTQDHHYEESYDIWQLGYIIQCILLRDKNKLYSKQKDRPIEEQVYENIFKSDWEKVKLRFPKFYEVVKQMMDYDPQKRPALVEIEEEINKIN
ncbi:unnamed protein product (macronuclear) [Paramecium tetraurelia]|uniref:Protein kinase domain-containing protein n=1 Tax=Paramecium tetraurelia TaxID=5888 RepID=A0E4N4_PARTE|nr:uncharacterized protein GSPATT00023426001 [Paramecium tetraurelia]CAK90251.1 unnamed protein product [Paramecium tetraurelia]|eukprot:XP_001457648.1 hypothetical protein (macronuclear) [Paramecium tetraurelia strain d4-2]